MSDSEDEIFIGEVTDKERRAIERMKLKSMNIGVSKEMDIGDEEHRCAQPNRDDKNAARKSAAHNEDAIGMTGTPVLGYSNEGNEVHKVDAVIDSDEEYIFIDLTNKQNTLKPNSDSEHKDGTNLVESVTRAESSYAAPPPCSSGGKCIYATPQSAHFKKSVAQNRKKSGLIIGSCKSDIALRSIDTKSPSVFGDSEGRLELASRTASSSIDNDSTNRFVNLCDGTLSYEQNIDNETDSVLLSSSLISNSESYSLNDTLEEVEMLMKHGLDYVMAKEKSVSTEKKENSPPDYKLSWRQDKIAGQGKAHCNSSKVNGPEKHAYQTIHSPAKRKSPGFSTSSAKLKRGNSQKSNAVEKVRCTQVNKQEKLTRSGKYFHGTRPIVSPVAAYIKSNPTTQLATAVKINPHEKCGSLKVVPMHSVAHLKQQMKSSLQDTPVLPEVSYNSAPVVDCGELGVKLPQTPATKKTPKIMKHTGRAILACVSQSVAVDTNAEVSLIYNKDAGTSSTI